MERTIFCDVALASLDAPTSTPTLTSASTLTVEAKLASLCLPEKLEMRSVSFFDAVSYLRQEGYRLDPDDDLPQRGIPVWVGVQVGAPLILGEPGESRPLEHWLGKQRLSAGFPAGTCLGSVWQTLAAIFGLEMHVHEEQGALVLWLPNALAVGPRLDEDRILGLRLAMESARELLRRRGF